jgi:MGT family glycosyltransferase
MDFCPELGTVAEILDDELEDFRAERPDYLLTDSVAPWGQWMGQLLDRPVVTSVTTFAFNRHVLRYGTAHGVRPRGARFVLSKLRHIGRALWLRRQLQRRHGVSGPTLMSTMSGQSDLTIVYTSRAFQPCAETFDDRYRFVGPLLAPRTEATRFPWDRLTHPVMVYVSLGTLFNVNASFYRSCFEAFRNADFQVVLSIGRTVPVDSLGVPPANILVQPHVPQLDVLARASAFVTHGGMNSVNEGLFHGVPLVVIPQMSEQEIVGGRTAELGRGSSWARPA